ncbi:DgaE family pyridoxal phosphate-dependent ammonia lyase [Vagococcus carniphilus]|uniref:DgaE family pyridoxal phosphate-dependent ammonia lyase n=1 Tax=Vagococcus carniphilus TaxID=218144 RepID=A0AAW8U6Y9_9ENTE|nr:DgaE family pyridoxal phosphate-dependent ammonia lyase [Vagococcus carniphilus]MDT2831593.1 DgaE family pyridoxal phosphate-dependent ammonia lyase [Vagococcus carniphilus]MDT2834019.1 DgaE family pyridoxal phosphate-dependent ammonia lyase [Vagococcus carniphilus]MDT2840499.1 DgaE family pyridoxal phosphate-dependent ammonia lyase [Vagococcus carniphilus]MDT2855157.1 DgaE family pyridoxal phosphate-dependent ammonia lyase [Vagococcus carniphilus]MDT2863761.1 DgaE family pyridoxal phosphat
MSIYKKFNLKKVINASGKMTILGVSKVRKSVFEAQQSGGETFFEMSDLLEKSGDYLGKLLETESGTITSSASAGIALSIAALIGEGDDYHLYHPYTNRISKREVIIPKGHNVNYGTGVEVMIEQGGGKVVEAGFANECSQKQIEMEITDNTAALLYIKSHHTVQKSMLSIEEMVQISKKYQIPLIIDAAAEEDLFTYTKQGADLVIYSGAKAIEGPSSGFVIGKKKYIRWIQLQNKGLGRSMKIGKDNILGLMAAIESFLEEGSESGEAMKERLMPFIDSLNQIDGILAEIVPDPAGRDIYRAQVKIQHPNKTALDITQELKQGNVAIYTRDYQANNGKLEFDIRQVSTTEMNEIVNQLKILLTEED